MKRTTHHTPQPTTPPPKDSGAVTEYLQALRRAAGIPTGTVATGRRNRYGKDLPLYAEHAGAAHGRAAILYGGLPFDRDRLLRQREAVCSKGYVVGLLEVLLTDARNDYQAEAGALADMVTATIAVSTATIDHPTTHQDVRVQAQDAAQELLALNRSRLDDRTEAWGATHARNTTIKTRTADNAKLKLENRFLSGDELRPEDVGAEAVPAAARASRRKTSRRTT